MTQSVHSQAYELTRKIDRLPPGLYDVTGIPYIQVFEDDSKEQSREIVSFLTYHKDAVALSPYNMDCVLVYLAREPKRIGDYSPGQEILFGV